MIRDWVHSSGWMEGSGLPRGNPEENVDGIGQLLALVFLAWVLVWVGDEVHSKGVKT